MHRNKIQVSSGTYCDAPAQFERRMMSQIDLTAALSDCWPLNRLLLRFVGWWEFALAGLMTSAKL